MQTNWYIGCHFSSDSSTYINPKTDRSEVPMISRIGGHYIKLILHLKHTNVNRTHSQIIGSSQTDLASCLPDIS